MRTELVQIFKGRKSDILRQVSFLVSGYIYEDVCFTDEEINYCWSAIMEATTWSDGEFPEKYRESELEAQFLLTNLRFLKEPVSAITQWGLQEYLFSFKLTPNEYFGLKKQGRTRDVKTFLTEKIMEKVKFPEPRRIGVGYRDKGTAQNFALDGSPSWQEVAGATNLVEYNKKQLKVVTFHQ